MGYCAGNTSSVTKYKNSRIISYLLLAGHLLSDKKKKKTANSTIGKASGSLGWDGKVCPRQMLILELYIQKKSCELWSWAKHFLLHHHKSSFAPWYKYPSMFYKAAINGKGKGSLPWSIWMHLMLCLGSGLRPETGKKIQTNVEWSIPFPTCSISPLEERSPWVKKKKKSNEH